MRKLLGVLIVGGMLAGAACGEEAGDGDSAVTTAAAASGTTAPVTSAGGSTMATSADAATAATAVGDDTTETTSAGAATTEATPQHVEGPIRIMAPPNSEALTLFVAEEAGLFEDRGLEVEIVDGHLSEVALVANEIELGQSQATDVLNAAQEGVPLVYATGLSLNTAENPRIFLVAGKDSGIQGVADLAGKRIAVAGRGGVFELPFASLMEEQGVDPESVNWVEMPSPQMADALNQGAVDAAATAVPFVTFMEAAGHSVLIDASDLAPEAGFIVLSARREWAEDHTDTVLAIREALAEAAELIADDPDFAKQVEQEYTGIPADIVNQIPFATFTSEVTVEQIEVWLDVLEQRGLVEPGIDVESLIVPPPS